MTSEAKAVLKLLDEHARIAEERAKLAELDERLKARQAEIAGKLHLKHGSEPAKRKKKSGERETTRDFVRANNGVATTDGVAEHFGISRGQAYNRLYLLARIGGTFKNNRFEEAA